MSPPMILTYTGAPDVMVHIYFKCDPILSLWRKYKYLSIFDFFNYLAKSWTYFGIILAVGQILIDVPEWLIIE